MGGKEKNEEKEEEEEYRNLLSFSHCLQSKYYSVYYNSTVNIFLSSYISIDLGAQEVSAGKGSMMASVWRRNRGKGPYDVACFKHSGEGRTSKRAHRFA